MLFSSSPLSLLLLCGVSYRDFPASDDEFAVVASLGRGDSDAEGAVREELPFWRVAAARELDCLLLLVLKLELGWGWPPLAF